MSTYTEMLTCLDLLKPVVIEDQFNATNEAYNLKGVEYCLETSKEAVIGIANANDTNTAIKNTFQLAGQVQAINNLSPAEKVALFRKIYREYKGYDAIPNKVGNFDSNEKAAIVMGCTLIGAVAGAICGGLIGYATAKKYPLALSGGDQLWIGHTIFMGAAFGSLAGLFISSALYRATDEFKELRATRDTRKNEFEGYMRDAGLNGIIEEFKAGKK